MAVGVVLTLTLASVSLGEDKRPESPRPAVGPAPSGEVKKPRPSPAPATPSKTPEVAAPGTPAGKPAAQPLPGASMPESRALEGRKSESAPTPAPARAPDDRSIPHGVRLPMPIEGSFLFHGTQDELEVRLLRGEIYELRSSEGWQGVGLLDGTVYRGVFKCQASKDPRLNGAMGVHTIDWRNRDEPVLYATYIGVAVEPLQQQWRRRPPGDPGARGESPGPADPDRPRFGDHVYVEELPEVVTKVAPVYPDEARQAGAQGQVVVQALVLKDGTVGDTRIVKSVPMLDTVAVAAVRQYRFKPARSKGEPVAVWVAIPVQFTLH